MNTICRPHARTVDLLPCSHFKCLSRPQVHAPKEEPRVTLEALECIFGTPEDQAAGMRGGGKAYL